MLLLLLSSQTGCDSTPTPVSLLPAPGREARPARPLSALRANPRYFGADGRAVFLTGSHTWNNFQDWDGTVPPRKFDYDRYLDFLEQRGHNFIRLYVWEQAAWFPASDVQVTVDPLPYLRTGPGNALDGRPRFDLERFNPEYFQRLHDRVERAGARGIYVSVMLFNGWSVALKGHKTGNPWRGHPFNGANNVNGIDGDLDHDGQGNEVQTLANPAVTALQKRYVRKVVETLSDLDNVLWEISNESDPGSIEWQYEMILTVRKSEAQLGRSHPVGISAVFPPTSDNAPLFESSADWVSPHSSLAEPYDSDPPAASGKKVVVVDTDHIWGIGGSSRWVFESLLRGLNPIFMDPCVTALHGLLPEWPPEHAREQLPSPCPSSEWDSVRQSLGVARALAERVDLATLEPSSELASSRFCLAQSGKEYLVLVPWDGGPKRRWLAELFPRWLASRVDVDLSGTAAALDVEWIDLQRGLLFPGGSVRGGGHVELREPFVGDAMLHLVAQAPH
ncbi:MAG TPA: DUF4038 domain-containing protein [Myxococcota bacterium]|nr:DUF4038 domain-containing protein [Myxococcota bacterium]